MNLQVLAVEADISTYNKQLAVWKQHGFSGVRVNSMHEAIRMLKKTEFILTVINADSVIYKPMLKIMREETSAPIIIFTSNFVLSDRTEAFLYGADGYDPFNDDINENVKLALAVLKRYTERSNQPLNPSGIIIQDNLIVCPGFRRVFINGDEILLSTKEFDLLHLFIKRPGIVYTYEQIYAEVWGLKYDADSKNTIWTNIRRLRNKLFEKSNPLDYILTVRDVGYSYNTVW